MLSKTSIITKNPSDRVNMNDEIFGSIKPMVVLLKVGFRNDGIVRPNVIRNQFTGHIKCDHVT